MNYIELINAFWRAHDEHQFDVTEIALYFYLLKWCNYLHWKNPFERRSGLVCEELSISKPTLQKARQRLQDAKIIKYTSKMGNPNVKYQLIEIKVEKIFRGLSAGLAPGLGIGTEGGLYKGNDVHNININQTKQNNTYRAFAHLSISVEEFLTLEQAGYSTKEIDAILDAIENYKKNTNYKSLAYTAKKWLEKNRAKKSTPSTVTAKSIDRGKIDKVLDAFEIYKSKNYYTDWDNAQYDFLSTQGLITFSPQRNYDFLMLAVNNAKQDSKRLAKIMELDKSGGLENDRELISDAKQIALITFFNDLAEVGQELKDLLN